MIAKLCGTDQVYPWVTFGALPDDVLLEIFDFYYLAVKYFYTDAWHTLVHVCRRWRSIVFASPHRLKLQLLCTSKRPVKNMLNIWPELPIVIISRRGISKLRDVDNLIAALKQHNRVAKIDVSAKNSLLKRVWAMEMNNPFSALTFLRLHSREINAPVLPDSFLGGSAPRLQILSLDGVPFPALPNLLLSTRDLVELHLSNMPPSGYISPEAMVSSLSALTRLQKLRLEFRIPQSQNDRQNQLIPRLTRVVLPVLTELDFEGDSEYLEDIVAQIDTPLLIWFKITFINQLVLDTPSLHHFVIRSKAHLAEVIFFQRAVEVLLYPQNETSSLAIYKLFDRQLPSLAQVCNSALSLLPTLERLEINVAQLREDDVENAQWVELLRSFTSVKDLLLVGKSIRYVAPALDSLAWAIVTKTLPALQNILLEGPQPSKRVKKEIGRFVTAGQQSGRPVAVHHKEPSSPTWQQMHWDAGD
jgi:hypothetical protein